MKKGNANILFIFFLVVMFAADAQADTLYLKNGGVVEGIIEKEDEKSIELNMGFGAATFQRQQVKSVKRSSQDDNTKTMIKWEEKKREIDARAKEFEDAREKRLDDAYENLMEDARQKKLKEEGEVKHIQIARDDRTKGILVQALLNEKIKVSLVLDTGASLIILSRRIGEELGVDMADEKTGIIEFKLADGRSASAKAVVLDSVRIQDVEVKSVMAAVMLGETNDPSLRDGLLGMSFLSRFNLKMDLKSMKITLEKINNTDK
ncbi:MAG: retropepsin-like aspartic protease [Candidatus Omnitrophota bacterium]|nr:retropepsin-like aspartic protease [Candidatus Omnitrophota bacterium]